MIVELQRGRVPHQISHQDVISLILTLSSPHRKDNIAWECQNGGQLWPASVTAGYDNGSSFPSAFCVATFPSIYTAFVISLLADLGFQVRVHGVAMVDFTYSVTGWCQTARCWWICVRIFSQIYMLFLNWRFSKRLEHYDGMKGPYYGGKTHCFHLQASTLSYLGPIGYYNA